MGDRDEEIRQLQRAFEAPTPVHGVHCRRCDHRWIPRTEKKPQMCPRCKSRGWESKPRR